MKVMTFNTQHCLNFIQRFIDYPLMAKTITRSGADIVALQEMRGQGSADGYMDQTGMLAQLTGMHHYFAQAIGYDGVKPYGNGVLSRIPILSAETIIIPDPVEKTGPRNYETRCLLKVVLEGNITVLATHMGLNTDEQALAVQTILEHLPPEKCVLMGDFNAEPDAPVLQPLYTRMKDVAALIPGPAYTFPSNEPIKKIDYIFVSPDVQVQSAQVLPVIASDHLPHMAQLIFG